MNRVGESQSRPVQISEPPGPNLQTPSPTVFTVYPRYPFLARYNPLQLQMASADDSTYLTQHGIPKLVDRCLLRIMTTRPTNVPQAVADIWEEYARDGGTDAPPTEVAAVWV